MTDIHNESAYRAYAATMNHVQQQQAKPATAGTIHMAPPKISEVAMININQAALRREFRRESK